MLNRALLALTALLLLSPFYVLPAREVRVGVPPGAMPLVGIEDGKLTGVIGQMTETVLHRMGHTAVVESMPFARLYQQVEEGGIDIAARVLASDDRRRRAFYSEPIVTEYQVIVVPRARTFQAERIDDLIGKNLGTQRGFIYPTLDNKDGVTLTPGDSVSNNVNKMLSGRLDGVIVNSVFGVYQLRKDNLLDRIDILPSAASPVPLSVALSNARFTEDERQQFNQYLTEGLASAEFQRIRNQYGDPALFKVFALMRQYPRQRTTDRRSHPAIRPFRPGACRKPPAGPDFGPRKGRGLVFGPPCFTVPAATTWTASTAQAKPSAIRPPVLTLSTSTTRRRSRASVSPYPPAATRSDSEMPAHFHSTRRDNRPKT